MDSIPRLLPQLPGNGEQGRVSGAMTLPNTESTDSRCCRCFLANCGQEEDWDTVKSKAVKLGAERMIIQDVQQELIDELVWPAIQCNAIYEDRCKIPSLTAY
jgi:argininosuccinate synthase